MVHRNPVRAFTAMRSRRLRGDSPELLITLTAVALSVLAGWFVVYVSEPHLDGGGTALAATPPAPRTSTAAGATPPVLPRPATTTPTIAAAAPPTSPPAKRNAARTRSARRAAPVAKTTARVRVQAPAGRPSYVCVDDGRGHQLYSGMLSGTMVFLGGHLRLNVGLSSTRITVNGKPLETTASPASWDITRRGRATALPAAQSPCG